MGTAFPFLEREESEKRRVQSSFRLKCSCDGRYEQHLSETLLAHPPERSARLQLTAGPAIGMLAVMVHRGDSQEVWNSTDHWGACGQSCGCCRAVVEGPWGFGACAACSWLPELQDIYQRLVAFCHASPAALVSLHGARLLPLASLYRHQNRVFGPDVLRRVAAYLGDCAAMAAGVVCAGLISRWFLCGDDEDEEASE